MDALQRASLVAAAYIVLLNLTLYVAAVVLLGWWVRREVERYRRQSRK